MINVLHDYSGDDVSLNDHILESEPLKHLFSIFGVLQRSSIAFQEIRLDDRRLEELQVTTYDGPRLFFSLRFPATPAAAALASLRSAGGFRNLQYIDFRVENRVYYK